MYFCCCLVLEVSAIALRRSHCVVVLLCCCVIAVLRAVWLHCAGVSLPRWYQIGSGTVAQVQQLLEVATDDVQQCVETMASRVEIAVRAAANRGPHRYAAVVSRCGGTSVHYCVYRVACDCGTARSRATCHVWFLGRLLTNEHAQLMWFTYCGASSDRVALDTFVMAVSTYLEEQLGMPLDAVEGVLTPECREALTLALDVDGNGEVSGQPAVRLLSAIASKFELGIQKPSWSARAERRVCSAVLWLCVLLESGDGVGGESSTGHTGCAVP